MDYPRRTPRVPLAAVGIPARLAPLAALLATLAASALAAEPATPPRPAPLTVTVVRGLWHETWRIEEALAHAGGGLLTDVWVHDGCGSGWPGPGDQGAGGLVNFPDTNRLAGVRVLVVANTSAKALAPHLPALRAHINAGNGLLLLGGRFAFGRQYRESPLAELAPVTFPGEGPWGSDLRQAPDGLALAPVGAAFGTLAWKPHPHVFWLHDVRPKPGAEVALTAGDAPLLVTGAFGTGRVALCAGTVMGEPPAGTEPFWSWQGWPALLGTTLRWLGEPSAAANGALDAAARAAIADTVSRLEDATLEEGAEPDPVVATALLALARRCRHPADLILLLGAASAFPGDIPPALADALTEAAWPLSDPGLAAPARSLLASGHPYKTALGAAALGASRAANARATLETLAATGRPAPPAAGSAPDAPAAGEAGLADMATLKPVTEQEAARQAAAIRLAALAGLAHLADPASAPTLRRLATVLAADGAPRPLDYADVLTDAHRLYQQALLARLHAGDPDAAAPLVDALLENVYTLARARTEANKPDDRLSRVHAGIPALEAWRQTVQAQLATVPDPVLPALAAALARCTDRRAAPLALAACAGRTLAPEVRTALRASPIPAIAALAGANTP